MPETQLTAYVGDLLTAEGRWEEWFPDEPVRNFGAGGATTEEVVERLPEIIEASPTTVVLLIGTNDLAWRRSAELIVRNIETILATLRRDLPESYLLIQSVLPRAREYAEIIKEINTHLWQFAPAVRAQYLDLWSQFATEDGSLNSEYSEDGLRLNVKGYEAWLAELRPALETLRSHQPMSTSIPIPPENLTKHARR